MAIQNAIDFIRASSREVIIVEEPDAYAALWRIEDSPATMLELMEQASIRSGFEKEHREMFFNMQHMARGFVITKLLH